MEDKKLTIYYLSGTHWDREWYQPFQGFRSRLVTVTNEIIDTLENHPEFGVFHFDGQTIVLEDYLEIEPEKRSRLARLIQDRRLIIGPWYVMPDEFLLSGESLIRNLMIGRKISAEWGTAEWKYGYVCDIFGHIAQMPQIFNGFGIRYSVLGRGTNEHTLPAHFVWQSPDGSSCITYKLKDSNGYGAFCIEALGWNSNGRFSGELHPKIKEYIDYEIQRSGVPVVLIMDAIDHEPIHGSVPDSMDIMKELYPGAEVKNVNLEEMGGELEEYRALLPVKKGELNETGRMEGGYLYLITNTLSSRYPVKKENDECQTLLEQWVEPLAAVSSLKGFHIQKSYVDLAYKYLIQNHAHDSICGCSVDQIYKDMEYRFNQARIIANQIIESILEYERGQHDTDTASPVRILQLFNPLPFSRNEVITADIEFGKDYTARYTEPFGCEEKNSFKIYDYTGKEIPYGIVRIKKDYQVRRYNQFAEKVDIYTISFEAYMPAAGTAEYKIVPSREPSRYLGCMAEAENEAENEYIKISVNDNGTLDICDKVSGRHYNRLLSYLDDGETGDGGCHSNPVEDRVITSQGSRCTIERVENGPSRTVFSVTNYMTVPAGMEYHTHGIRRSAEEVALKICSFIGLSKGADYVDVETVISNNARDHRLRLHLPTGIESETYFVNQPYAFVRRKAGIDISTQNWKECEVPEKQMGGIVGMQGGDGTGLVFLSAYGLHECAVTGDRQGSMDITLFRSFGRTVFTNGEEGGQIQGELRFKYCIKPMQRDTSYGELIGLQSRLQTGIRVNNFGAAGQYALSEPQSHLEISGSNICTSMVKRPESGEKGVIVVRCCNMSDAASTANIRCFQEIKGVDEVDLKEELIGPLDFETDVINIEIDAWKIKTLKITL